MIVGDWFLFAENGIASWSCSTHTCGKCTATYAVDYICVLHYGHCPFPMGAVTYCKGNVA